MFAADRLWAAAPFFNRLVVLHRIDVLGRTVRAAATIAESKPVPLDENASRYGLALVHFHPRRADAIRLGLGCRSGRLHVGQPSARARDGQALLIQHGRHVLATALSPLPVSRSAEGERAWTRLVGRLTAVVFAVARCLCSRTSCSWRSSWRSPHGVTACASMLDDTLRHAGLAFAIMAFIAALATAPLAGAPTLELLLAGPLFALALYQRYAYRTVVRRPAAETNGTHRPAQSPRLQDDLGRRDGRPGVVGPLVSMDIDDVKAVNASLGHPRQATKSSSCCAQIPRSSSVAQSYRVGGEEFALLFEACTADEAQETVAELHRHPARLRPSPTKSGSPVQRGRRRAVSGMASSRDALLRARRQRAYWAKNHRQARRACSTRSSCPVLTRQQDRRPSRAARRVCAPPRA